MPPTQTSAWHWSDVTFLDTKRLKHHLHDNNNAKQIRLEDCVHSKCCKVSLQQGKITEYFKAQLKPQKKYDLKYHVKNFDSSRKKLAVRLSNTIVPVAAKISLVFQQQKSNKVVSEHGILSKSNRILTDSPQHRKAFNSSHEFSKTHVTSVFRKPDSVPKCSSLYCESDDSVDSVLLPEPKTLSEDCAQNTACSTPIPSPINSISPPLSVSTLEHCLGKPSLPSPILRTPSIIRFPVRSGWQGHFLADIMCRWSDCEESFSTNSALLEHLQVKHVNTQSLSETFVCRWIGCKVFDRASCSRSWLERHVLSHGGNKPFRCIVDGCGQRFSSQIMLERHVNQHFSHSENSSSSGTAAKRSLESTPNKLFRRNGKKLRYRRQPFSARMFDYIDTGVMEGVQHSLLEVSKRQSLGQSDSATSKSITLHSKVMGRRTANDGTATVLLKWFPSGIAKDEWVPQSQVTSTQQVAWKQCQDHQHWSGPPLFRRRPRHNQRKQPVTR